MFSPQRKAVSFAASGKGKTASFVASPPPLGSLSEKGSLFEAERMGDVDDWRRFKEAGLLDEAAIARRDNDALAEKVSKLETQLYDYQYNMGLLLIEKEDWSSKFEELRQALSETQEILKREQTAHLIALSETEKREENLRKALFTEKQCLVELEMALREMNAEQAKIKRSSDSTLAEANTLLFGVEEKSLELDKKLYAAEAKLATSNRKSSSLNRMLEEVDARECLLQKEHQTLRTEREAHKARFERQQEDLNEWEQRLHQREVSLCQGRRNLDEREEKANENERIHTEKEMELQELHKKINSFNLDLKQKKEDINKQLEDLLSKEKEGDSLRISLDKKEKELHKLEEKLSAQEKIKFKQLLDEHKASLDMKMQEFDLELIEKRKSLEKELSYEIDMLRKKESEVNHREEKLKKREHAIHERSERLKEKNKEADEKTKAMKEREKSIKTEERKLEAEAKQLVTEKESLQSLLLEVEKIKAENIQLERKICEERETLRITNKERSEHAHLQFELKQEIEKFRLQKELVLDETKELQEEKENFEKQWEDLDQKRSKVSAELEELAGEKDRLEKLQQLEEGRLKEEKMLAQEFIQRELENLKFEKDSFADKMKAEKLALAEKAQLDRTQMVQDFESRSQNLEIEMQNQREKTEKHLRERQRAFEDERERELNSIKLLKEEAYKEIEEVRAERVGVEKKREELALNKEKLRTDQIEMQNDIDQLGLLSKKIRDQREELIRERGQFLAFVDKLKSCNGGEEVTRELMLSGFRVPDGNRENAVPLPTLAEETFEISPDLGSSKSEGRVSWVIRKCTSSMLKLSPGKKSEHDHTATPVESKTEEKAKQPSTSEDKALAPLRKCTGATDAQKIRSEKATEVGGCSLAANSQSHLDSTAEEGPEDSLQSEPKSGRRKPGRRSAPGIHRTRSVQTAIKEAEAFLGETHEEPRLDETALPSDVNESLGDSVRAEKGKAPKKRQRGQTSHISENEADGVGGDSEACSGSVAAGGSGKKKHQTAPPGSQTPREERYELRSRKNVSSVIETAEPKMKKDKEVDVSVSVSSSGAARKSSGTSQLGHATAAKTVEFSENKVVRFITPDENTDESTGAEKSVEEKELSEEVNDSDKNGGEDESGSSINESENDPNDDDELQPGEVSIGKKLWTFFTT